MQAHPTKTIQRIASSMHGIAAAFVLLSWVGHHAGSIPASVFMSFFAMHFIFAVLLAAAKGAHSD